jgi:hypothetical protein
MNATVCGHEFRVATRQFKIADNNKDKRDAIWSERGFELGVQEVQIVSENVAF